MTTPQEMYDNALKTMLYLVRHLAVTVISTIILFFFFKANNLVNSLFGHV